MSDDRAIEALAERLYMRHHISGLGVDAAPRWAKEGELHKETWRDMARADLRALASAGLQITDLTPEEALALTNGQWSEDLYRSGLAKLQALASSPASVDPT